MSENGQTHFKNLVANTGSVSDHFTTWRSKGLKSFAKRLLSVIISLWPLNMMSQLFKQPLLCWLVRKGIIVFQNSLLVHVQTVLLFCSLKTEMN